ncbi:MAG: hypothetical protein Q8K58_15700 [Acidimicrobiales bacterium]|nr:hypothetical protein [Acidimicrobiales bacterium]
MPAIVTAETSAARRAGILLLGLVLVAVGVACTIQADLGVAPYDVLSTGIRDLFDIPIAAAAVILPTVFLALGLALGGRIGPGSILAVALVGPMLGAALAVLPHVEALPPRIALFAVGFVVTTAGITAVVIPEIGPGPAELVMLALHDRGHPLAPVRTGIEVTSVAVGWAMGGQVGVGTAVFAVLVGPALRRTLELAGYESSAAAAASDLAAPGA